MATMAAMAGEKNKYISVLLLRNMKSNSKSYPAAESQEKHSPQQALQFQLSASQLPANHTSQSNQSGSKQEKA